MKKVLLDLGIPATKTETQEYIAEQMGFPDYYGKNLDALYDELTSIAEPTAVGIFLPIPDMIDLDIDLMVYFDRIGEVFTEAEESNPCLAVIFGDLVMNPGYEPEDDDFDDGYDEDGGEDGDPVGEHDIIFLDPGR